MKMCRLISFFVILAFTAGSSAHFHILIPEKASNQKGDVVVLHFKYGNPVEYSLLGWFAITKETKETEIIKNATTYAIKQRSTFWYFINPSQSS